MSGVRPGGQYVARPGALECARSRSWVLVVGMHRSGTSAVTGSLAALGLQEPHAADLMVGIPGNPNHHESFSLAGFSEHLLRSHGGSWSAPPDFPAGWEHTDDGDAWAAAGATVLLDAYPEPGPAVVKDPRHCVTLPFWLRVLGRPAGVLFMWRDPLSVARSVGVRSGWPLVLGLALWERYNRDALVALGGQNVLCVDYDRMMLDPPAFAARAGEWLAGLGAVDTAGAASVMRPDLVHSSGPRRPGEDVVLPAHAELVDVLESMSGHHPSFAPPVLPEPTPWASGLLDVRRELELAQRG